MQTIYLIRHGETDWNVKNLMQGQSDVPLNSMGAQQAKKLQDLAHSLRLDHVISSDLSRALLTAKTAFPQFEIRTDPRLREINMGQAEGLHRQELHFRFGVELVNQWSLGMGKGAHARLPGAETPFEALTRLQECITDWCFKNHNQRLAFVTHGMLIRLLAQEALNRFHPDLRAGNCSVFQFGRTLKGIQFHQIFLPIEGS